MPQSARDESRGYSGFDVDVANEIGKRLGLPVRFVVPAGPGCSPETGAESGTLPSPRSRRRRSENKKLVFPAVYRFDAAALVVPKNNTSIERPSDASGKTIGVRQETTFEDYLRRNLVLYNNPSAVTYVIDNPKICTFPDREQMVKALTDGKVDAVVTSLGLAEQDIAEGAPLRVLHGFLFFEPVAVAIDKGDPDFAAKIGDTVRAMRADGTLTNLSEKWFGIDVAGIVP